MTLSALTEKEKETLRLLLRGHDAKSSARELGLSVHTVNERLRDARRKLGVTSSREAARVLSEHEQSPPELFGDKALRDAAAPQGGHSLPPASDRRGGGHGAGRYRAWLVGGMFAMMIVAMVAALALAGGEAGVETAPPARAALTSPSEQAQEAAARSWLRLVDASDWENSYAEAGKAFRDPNTVAGWKAASEQARVPLGAIIAREAIAFEHINAPPRGYQLVKFKSDFAERKGVIELVTLEREGDTWRVVGYFLS